MSNEVNTPVNSPIVPLLMQTFTLKQFVFVFSRPEGALTVKFFSAPYGSWYVGNDNLPVKLSESELDGMYGLLRQMQAARREMNQSRNS